VLSGTTTDLVCDRLPGDAWLAELGTHSVRDLPRPERVVQLSTRISTTTSRPCEQRKARALTTSRRS